MAIVYVLGAVLLLALTVLMAIWAVRLYVHWVRVTVRFLSRGRELRAAERRMHEEQERDGEAT